MEILVTFIILSIVNVVLSTIRSIATIKCGKTAASFINAAYFAFYNIMLIYTVADFPLWEKCLVTFFCNLVGVYVVKWAEEKSRKDKLWLVKVTIPHRNFEEMKYDLQWHHIPFSYVDIEKYVVFDTYCSTQKQTEKVVEMAKCWKGKCFATENRL